jgi:hypothetical protein
MMNLIYKGLLLTALFLIPSVSFANLNGFKINFVAAYVDTDEECAAEGEITSDEGGLINGSEKLTVNGITWGSFAGLPTSGYSVGDKVSFGTDELALRLGVTYDVKLSTDICKGLTLGDSIEFFGSFGDQLTQLNIPEPMINAAWALNSAGKYAEVDLTQNSLWGTSLNGSMWTIGTGPIFGGGSIPTGPGGGCNIGGISNQYSPSMLLSLFTSLFGLAWVRLRRTR